MRRPVKLNFKPLSLEDTAKELGVPPGRARRILALFGIKSNGKPVDHLRTKKRSRTAKSSPRAARTRTSTR